MICYAQQHISLESSVKLQNDNKRSEKVDFAECYREAYVQCDETSVELVKLKIGEARYIALDVLSIQKHLYALKPVACFVWEKNAVEK